MIEPRLRFKADDGSDFPDWEEKTLGELGTFTKGATLSKADISDEGNPLILYGELYTTYKEVAYEVKRKTQAIVDKIYYSNVGDVLIPTSGESAEEISTATCVMVPNVILAGDLNIFRSTVIDGRIMSYILNYQAKRKIATIAQGKSIVHIQAKQLGKIFVEYPVDKDEQQKIADFLSTIDTIIEKQQATVSAWEERKKGVMQKLFSQEVRFKADDGSDFPDWEEKSFVNTFDSLNNSTFSRDCLNYENGSVKYIHYGDILVKYNSSVDVCDAIVPFVNEDLDCERFAILQDGDIVIADTAEDDTVGKVIEIENTSNVKTIAGLHTIACRPKEKFASKYLGYYMNSDEYHNQLRPYMQGIKVTSISKSNIALTKIMVPSLPEQQKIADCLSALDAVIEKQKETLEKWQELKKGLLQQMFV